MHLDIEISDALGALVEAQAKAAGITPHQFVSRVLESTLKATAESIEPAKPLQTGYGMLAKYGPAPSSEDIDENRREIFQDFAREF